MSYQYMNKVRNLLDIVETKEKNNIDEAISLLVKTNLDKNLYIYLVLVMPEFCLRKCIIVPVE
jgi:hypothetical protein